MGDLFRDDLKPNGPITPEKLRWLADFCDLADQALEKLAKDIGKPVSFGDEVQQDLRRWAAEIEVKQNAPQTWTPQVNDLIGGWIVTTYPHPLSAHDVRPEGDPNKRGYVIAECMVKEDAEMIASLLNQGGVPYQC
jgi:hypothetical protein